MRAPATQQDVEWPTFTLLLALYAAWLALVWFHAALPIWAWLPLAAVMSAWWSSAQHELIHGHPTPDRRINVALATPPFWLWLSFERYRRTHLTHHRDERLTDPLDDPESRYWTPECWQRLGVLGRVLGGSQVTLLGRLAIGPFWSVARFWQLEILSTGAGNRAIARAWAWHALWVALLLGFVLGAAGMPLWQYLLGFVWGGTAVALIRSFAEHRAHDQHEHRTAIVEDSPVLDPLFLFNNLHAVHHRWPSVPWYRLPALYHQHRAEVLERNDGLVYRGYADVFRRFLTRPHDTAIHPRGRAPGRRAVQAGSA